MLDVDKTDSDDSKNRQNENQNRLTGKFIKDKDSNNIKKRKKNTVKQKWNNQLIYQLEKHFNPQKRLFTSQTFVEMIQCLC